MYSTCLFCNSELGANEALGSFPVGRRLAFDARKGRLWVVCRKCERWNLTPLEERWEAIEQAERLFRDTRKRVSTENIGLTRLRDHTELVRIGEPLRPEYAAWRYGDQFGRRHHRQMWVAGGGLAAVAAILVGGVASGAAIAVVAGAAVNLTNLLVHGHPERVVARVRTSELGTVVVRRRHLAETQLAAGTDAPLALNLRFKSGASRIEGREALRIAGLLMPHVNRYGGDEYEVQMAVKALDAVGGADGFLHKLGSYAARATSPTKRKPKRSWSGAYPSSGLFGLNATDRLALEMALHEEAELRALQGELSELERAWRDAEEIAAIADNMLTPSSIQQTFDQLRRTNE
jgi:hypothetical protein